MHLIIQDIPEDKLSAEDMELLENVEAVSSIGFGNHTKNMVLNDEELTLQTFNLILSRARLFKKNKPSKTA